MVTPFLEHTTLLLSCYTFYLSSQSLSDAFFFLLHNLFWIVGLRFFLVFIYCCGGLWVKSEEHDFLKYK